MVAGSRSVGYAYLPNSDLLATSTFSEGGPQLVTTRTWEYGVRLKSINNTLAGTPVASHTYDYDSVNRREHATLEDGSRWDYGYNDRNEVISGKRFWSDGSAVSGQHSTYDFDNIGNRKTASFGGDSAGLNLRTIDYHPTDINALKNGGLGRRSRSSAEASQANLNKHRQ